MKNVSEEHNDLNDWIDALENLTLFNGKEDAKRIINQFLDYAANKDLLDQKHILLPFENSISQYQETEYPGDWDVEEKIRHYIRWNALITVFKSQ